METVQNDELVSTFLWRILLKITTTPPSVLQSTRHLKTPLAETTFNVLLDIKVRRIAKQTNWWSRFCFSVDSVAIILFSIRL